MKTTNRMKKIKNTALIALLVSGITATAQEQQPRAPKSAEQIAQMRTERLTERLALNDAQQQAVYALSLEDAKKMQEIRKERAARVAEARKARKTQLDERRSAMKATQERLNEILTDEQRQVLKQHQVERAEKMKSMRGGREKVQSSRDRHRKGKRHFHKRIDSSRATEKSPETIK